MMFYLFLFILLIASIYLGQVAGMIIHCELTDELKDARRFVWLVPLLRIIMFFSYLEDCVKDKQLKSFWNYLLYPEKNMVLILVLLDTLPKVEGKKKKEPTFIELCISLIGRIVDVLFDDQGVLKQQIQYM